MGKTLWLLFFSFLKVGLLGYGGGPSSIPLVQKEVVEVHGWMAETEFADSLAMGNALPGPIAVKMSVYIGYRVGGVPGAILALLGMTGPGIVLMALFSLIYLKLKDHPKVMAAMKAARPAVVGLLIWTAYDLGRPILLGNTGVASFRQTWSLWLLALASFVATTFLKVHPALVIVIAAAIGLLVY
ncbi:MAG: chromate transporter [Chloroflexia bacterium]